MSFAHLTTRLTRLIAPSRFGLLNGCVALAVLLAVLISQYGFGLHPCVLCLWQRYPYAGLLVLGFGMHFCACKRRSLTIAAWLITVLWAASFSLGLFHTGVEQHWWTFNSSCSSTIYEPGLSGADLLARIKAAPVTRCDQAATFLFGWSMALWNSLLSFGMLVLCLGYLYIFIHPRRSV